MRGTPLAMLAAQCNKLSSMSPPPLADAAVGKGFHPWKKSGGGGGACPSVTADSPEGRRLSTSSQQQPQQSDSPAQSTAATATAATTVTTATAASYSPTPQYGKYIFFDVSCEFSPFA